MRGWDGAVKHGGEDLYQHPLPLLAAPCVEDEGEEGRGEREEERGE